MHFRVFQEKVLLVKAIKEQEVISQGGAGRIGEDQLAREVQEICQLTGRPDITKSDINLEKEEIKEAITVSHMKHLKEEMTGAKLER